MTIRKAQELAWRIAEDKGLPWSSDMERIDMKTSEIDTKQRISSPNRDAYIIHKPEQETIMSTPTLFTASVRYELSETGRKAALLAGLPAGCLKLAHSF